MEVSFNSGSKSFTAPGITDGLSPTGVEAIRISSTFVTCEGALLGTLGLAGAGLGGGGRFGAGFWLSSSLGSPSVTQNVKTEEEIVKIWKKT